MIFVPCLFSMKEYFCYRNGLTSPHVRKSPNPEAGKILHVESWILGLESGIQLKDCRSPTKDWNPESKFQWQRPESGIHGTGFRIQDCPGFSYMGRLRTLTNILLYVNFLVEPRLLQGQLQVNRPKMSTILTSSSFSFKNIKLPGSGSLVLIYDVVRSIYINANYLRYGV